MDGTAPLITNVCDSPGNRSTMALSAQASSATRSANRVTERRKYDRYQRDPEIVRQYRGAWRAIRERYIRSHPLCEDCLESGRLTPAAEVHHLLPLSRGGTHDEENLRALCRSCHNKRHIALGDR